MANNSIYTSITEETVTGARDRVLDQLNELTDGQADVAIRYVSEFVELDNILREHRKRNNYDPACYEEKEELLKAANTP